MPGAFLPEFVELKPFRDDVEKILDYSEFRHLQQMLIDNPEAGTIMPGTGGFRKLRFPLQGQGKRGGARVIYYWFDAWDRIYLVYLYKKGKKDNLTAAQKKQLRGLAEALRTEPIPLRKDT